MLLSAGLLAVLVVMLIPLPTMLLDMLIATNLALTILLDARHAQRAAGAGSVRCFPSLLLLLIALPAVVEHRDDSADPARRGRRQDHLHVRRHGRRRQHYRRAGDLF